MNATPDISSSKSQEDTESPGRLPVHSGPLLYASSEWRSIGKPQQPNSRVNPFDLTQFLDSTSGIWKDNFLKAELGVNEDALNITRDRKYAGLLNMGATCYVNSFIQSVYFNTDFMALVLAVQALPDSALHAFQTLLADLRFSILARVSPLEFLDKFSIKLNLQEDAAEFSMLLLNWLDQQVGENRVRSLFEGRMEHSTVCAHCGHVSVRTEKFLEIQINADVGILRGSCFSHEEVIDGYRCGSPGCLPACPSGIRRSIIRSLPDHLRVVVNRYRYSMDAGREKISAPLTVPLSGLAIATADGTTERYSCKGILEHHSERASSGHYTASLRDDSEWWLFDDAVVEPISLTGASKRKPLKSTWSEHVCVSSSAYVVLFERECGGVTREPTPVQASLVDEANQRNALIRQQLEQKVILKNRLEELVADRKRAVDNLRDWNGREVTSPTYGIASTSLQAWSSGQDIRALFFPSVIGNVAVLCEHGGVSPLRVRSGGFKLVPTNITGDLPQTSVCQTCSEEVSAQLRLGVEFYIQLKHLIDAKYNFLTKSFENSDARGPAVWVFKPSIPKLRKDMMTSSAVLEKMCGCAVSDRSIVDITSEVVCVHGHLLPDAVTDSDFVLKPKGVIDRLVELSAEMRDDWFSFAPKIVAAHVLEMTAVAGCGECDSLAISKTSAFGSVQARLASILTRAPITGLNELVAGEQYFAFPSGWVAKLKSWLSGNAKSVPRDLRMDTLVCGHGDLKFDLVLALGDGGKLPFAILTEEEGSFMLSDEFRTILGITGAVSPVLIEKDRTYTVGTCPIVCPVCPAAEATERRRGVSIRVFHEPMDKLDSSTKAVRVNMNDTVILCKHGRSRLVGAAPAIDSTTTGVDVKLALIDIGILDQSPFPISPDDALGRLNLYVVHPSMRGSLVLVKDEEPIFDTIGSLGQAGRSTVNSVDTVFVEFTKASADSTPKRRRKGPVASDKDAGMQGSILRLG